MFAIADEEEESIEKKEYQNAAISEQVSNTDNLHLFSENLGKSMQYPRSKQFYNCFDSPTRLRILLLQLSSFAVRTSKVWTF